MRAPNKPEETSSTSVLCILSQIIYEIKYQTEDRGRGNREREEERGMKIGRRKKHSRTSQTFMALEIKT